MLHTFLPWFVTKKYQNISSYDFILGVKYMKNFMLLLSHKNGRPAERPLAPPGPFTGLSDGFEV